MEKIGSFPVIILRQIENVQTLNSDSVVELKFDANSFAPPIQLHHFIGNTHEGHFIDRSNEDHICFSADKVGLSFFLNILSSLKANSWQLFGTNAYMDIRTNDVVKTFYFEQGGSSNSITHVVPNTTSRIIVQGPSNEPAIHVPGPLARTTVIIKDGDDSISVDGSGSTSVPQQPATTDRRSNISAKIHSLAQVKANSSSAPFNSDPVRARSFTNPGPATTDSTTIADTTNPMTKLQPGTAPPPPSSVRASVYRPPPPPPSASAQTPSSTPSPSLAPPAPHSLAPNFKTPGMSSMGMGLSMGGPVAVAKAPAYGGQLRPVSLPISSSGISPLASVAAPTPAPPPTPTPPVPTPAAPSSAPASNPPALSSAPTLTGSSSGTSEEEEETNDGDGAWGSMTSIKARPTVDAKVRRAPTKRSSIGLFVPPTDAELEGDGSGSSSQAGSRDSSAHDSHALLSVASLGATDELIKSGQGDAVSLAGEEPSPRLMSMRVPGSASGLIGAPLPHAQRSSSIVGDPTVAAAAAQAVKAAASNATTTAIISTPTPTPAPVPSPTEVAPESHPAAVSTPIYSPPPPAAAPPANSPRSVSVDSSVAAATGPNSIIARMSARFGGSSATTRDSGGSTPGGADAKQKNAEFFKKLKEEQEQEKLKKKEKEERMDPETLRKLKESEAMEKEHDNSKTAHYAKLGSAFAVNRGGPGILGGRGGRTAGRGGK